MSLTSRDSPTGCTRATGGSPLYTTELARHLVDRGVIRYLDGLWSIPEDPSPDNLPRGLADAMDARVRSLPAPVRALGEALSVHSSDLPLPLIVHLADTRDDDAVFAALDQLGYEEILVQAGECWRFRHDGLREALLRGLDPERQRTLHLRVGEALAAASDGGVERDAEIGWHLLRGGDRVRGAARLERAGRALYASQSFADCIAPLEVALENIEARRGSARSRLDILHMLLMAGCMADRKAASRHVDACVQGFRYSAGVDVATRARRLVGRHAGVVIGLAWAFARWLVSPRRGPNPYRAFQTLFIVAGYAASIYAMNFDFAGSEAMVDLLEPVAILKNRIPWAAYAVTRAIRRFPRGEFAAACRDARRALEIVATDRITPIREIDRRAGAGGAQLILTLTAAINFEVSFERELAALGELQLKFFEIGAEQARIIRHRLCGDEQAAVEVEARVERVMVQLGPVWMMQAFGPILFTLAYAISRDTVGLRRMIEELSARCADGLQYDRFLELARGEYLRERGDAKAALVELEPLTHGEYPLLVAPALAAFAETWLALGDHVRAREAAVRAEQIATAPESYQLHTRLRATCTIALADAAAGDLEAARVRLEDAIAEARPFDCALLSGAVHEARARVALVAEDAPAYQLHRTETERLFRRTRNPVLVARAERLSEAGRTSRPDLAVVGVEAVTTPPTKEIARRVMAAIAGSRGSAERAQRVLSLVVDEARGVSGYLYLRSADAIELVAPTSGTEPPTMVTRAITAAMSSGDAATLADRPTRSTEPSTGLEWQPVLLTLRLDGATPIVVGGVAVIAGAMRLVAPAPTLLSEIARQLFEAGDVTR
jgi:hypothetical protein